ncbi:MAG TPA: glycosyltransferase family protein [Patescibacteria group bacterium]|nr:glycosyltransferase family protein [Patescibacteria group bacterium]
MKTAIIVQARMTSTRLPGKILKKVMGKPLLEYQMERLRRVSLADEIVIATTVNETDKPVVEWCQRMGVSYFRGSELDVLSRYYEAAKQYQADTVVRITADCPLIDPEVINGVIQVYQAAFPQYHYVSNCLERTYPRGMDVEVFAFSTLEEAYHEALLPAEREHVTAFIYNNPQRYQMKNVTGLADNSRYRWTVDTPEDFQLIETMLKVLYADHPDFTLDDALALLEKHPDWALINADIQQKHYGE